MVGELLESGKYNVAEAAREVGFNDLSHLNRCFRKILGWSPKTALKAAGKRICTNKGRIGYGLGGAESVEWRRRP